MYTVRSSLVLLLASFWVCFLWCREDLAGKLARAGVILFVEFVEELLLIFYSRLRPGVRA